ncbi:hypothetical protein EJM83_21530, partial [Shigella sonnei]|nr:hypothetical protein [Shigella sonnei]
ILIYQIITSSSILFIVWGITSIIIRTKNYFSKKKTDLNISFFIAFPISITILLFCRGIL